MCGRAGRLTGAPLGCKQQAARWGEASSMMGRQDEGEADKRSKEGEADKRSKEGEASRANKTVQQQAARWGEASWARCWRSSKQQCRQEKQAARWGRHGKQDRIRSKQQARCGRLKQAANGARWEKL